MMKFSVIVPVYNCINDLSACVSSILQQTKPDFELLLVDDGSTDGSAELCDRLSEQDRRIHVFHKSNGGASSARNLGLKYAKGDFILFFDGDDTVEPDLLEQVSAALSDASPQMVIFGMAFDYLGADGQLKKTDHLSVKHAGPISSEIVCAEFSDFFEDNALSSACNKVFSGDVLRDKGLLFSEEMTLYEDLDFVLRCLPHCPEIMCLDRALYHYRLPMQAPHLNRRVMHLDQLHRNLELLSGSVLALGSQVAAQKTADLCAQLFDMHLMTVSYSRKQLQQAVENMRECPALRALSQVGVKPSEASCSSWPLICQDAVSALYVSLQKRKLIRSTKAIVKPALRKIGLYN